MASNLLHAQRKIVPNREPYAYTLKLQLGRGRKPGTLRQLVRAVPSTTFRSHAPLPVIRPGTGAHDVAASLGSSAVCQLQKAAVLPPVLKITQYVLLRYENPLHDSSRTFQDEVLTRSAPS